MFKLNISCFCLLCAFVLNLSGCGSSGPAVKLVPVTGKVTVGGKPLVNATVEFRPAAAGAPSSGVTDAEGKFELMYKQNMKGAVIGTHQVMITENVAMPQLAADGSSSPQPLPLPKEPKFFTANTEVKEQNSEFKFDF